MFAVATQVVAPRVPVYTEYGTKVIEIFNVETIGETSSGTKRTKLSASVDTSNPFLATPESELNNVTDGIDALQVETIGETSSCTERTKLSARDLLAILSGRRISIDEIQFIGESPCDGGTYGDVLVATFVKTGGSGENGKRVAVKKLRFVIDGDMTEEKFLRIFVNELRVLDKLSNPHIVKLLGFVEDAKNRIAWLVFPWEENGNLRKFLRSDEWEIPERVSLIFDVATGLEYLHTRKPPICHGDLKSLNILVKSSNRAVITDFGSARVIRRAQEASASPATQPAASETHQPVKNKDFPQIRITTFDTVLTLTGPACSLRWSPPEALKGELLDLATDIWALGWVAWEAITGSYPFEEVEGELGITMKIIEGRLPLIHDHMQLSRIYPLRSMMEKCWELEPKKRPSITECRQGLELMPLMIPVVKVGNKPKSRSTDYLLQVGDMHRWQNRHEEASKAYNQGLTMAQLTGNQAMEARILVQLAENDRERSKDVEAEAAYTKALDICKRFGYGWCGANAWRGLGDVQQAQSKYVEAEAAYTEALAHCKHIGYDWCRANALRGLGDVQQARSKYVEAEAAYTEALTICESTEDDWCRASALRGLGDVQEAGSKFVEAEASYSQALAIYESVGADLGRANALLGLGDVQRGRSKYTEAGASYTQALAIYERIGGSDHGRANALLRLGDVQRGRSNYAEAEASYTQALTIYQSVGNALGRADVLIGLGDVQLARSQYVEGEASYTQALAVYESIGGDLGRANALRGLGDVQLARSNYPEAEASYAQALAIHQGVGNATGRAGALYGLGDVELARAKYVEAEVSYTQALAIYQSIGEATGRVKCWLRLGRIRLSQARYAEAKTLSSDASVISEQIGYGWGKGYSKQFLEEVVEAENLSTEPPLIS